MTRWWIRLTVYGYPHWKKLVLIALLGFVGVGLAALAPWPMKLIVDYVLLAEPLPDELAWIALIPGGDAPGGLLTILATAMVIAFFAQRINEAFKKYVETLAGIKMTYGLGNDILDRLQRMSLLFHSRMRVGDLVRRTTTDSECIRELWIGTYLPLVHSLAALIVMFTIMWQLNALVAVLAICMVLPLGGVIKAFSPRMKERNLIQQEREGDLMALAEQSLNAGPMIQAFDRIEHEDQRFRDLSGRTLQASMRTLSSQLWFSFGVGGTTAIGMALILGIGGLHVVEGVMTLGSLLVVLSYVQSLYSTMQNLAYLSSRFATAGARARRVFAIMDADDSELLRKQYSVDRPHNRPKECGGHLRLERVFFGYESERPVIRDISFEAVPGETIALVGRSGAGKTTLVSLIMRFFDPCSGRILIDGTDIRSIHPRDWRQNIALVLQESFLLPLTVAENIAYGRPEASRQAVIEAAIAANAHDFIERLPRGYDTVVGESGSTLSGGERQRVAIARGFLKDAPILILDEPTAAVDAQTEEFLVDAIERLTQDRTTIIIAHRLSTIRKCNRTIVLKDGRAVEDGAYEELLASQALYRQFRQPISD